jgi:BirA family transcriptional regulator, biotin operon repressor / biotin---[acetyl-CoA-carboxylase] ligase
MAKNDFVKKTIDAVENLHLVHLKNIMVFPILPSTNSKAKELAFSGAADGTMVCAHIQTQGRGRFDRVWESPKGGLYLSILLRPKNIPAEKISLLTFLAALACVKTLQQHNVSATIKWPNDVRVSQKKISGILLESELIGKKIDYVIVGIGINLNNTTSDLSAGIQAQATSVKQETGKKVDDTVFLGEFLHQFDQHYSLFIAAKYNELLNEWKTYSDTIGKQIQINTSTEKIQGTAVDIDDSGFLLVRTSQGEIKRIISGDCLYLNEL